MTSTNGTLSNMNDQRPAGLPMPKPHWVPLTIGGLYRRDGAPGRQLEFKKTEMIYVIKVGSDPGLRLWERPIHLIQPDALGLCTGQVGPTGTFLVEGVHVFDDACRWGRVQDE